MRRGDPNNPEVREVPIEQTPYASGGYIAPLGEPVVMPAHYPRRGDRALRRVVWVLGALALLEAIILMTGVLYVGASVADRLGDPGPAPSIGCPFAEEDCGG